MSLWSSIKGFRLPRLPVPVDLPPPGTFSEGQRSLFGCLASGAGMAAFAFAVWITRFFMTGKWSPEILPLVIEKLGTALLAALLVMASVTIGLLVGGPVGRFKGGISKDGANLELEDHDSPQVQTTTATTTTTTAARSKPAAEPDTPTEEPFEPEGNG